MAADASPVTFTRHGIARGLRATLPVAISVAAYGVVFGVLARQVGVTLLEAML
jgi:predicted branched-subunit amino acid permease